MTEEENTVHIFKFRYLLAGLAVLLFLLSILTYSSEDLNVLAGGVSEPIHNWAGPLGAHISRAFFLLFGVATYPIVLLLLLCVVRSFIPRPVNRKGYIPSLLTVIVGLSILFAVFPASWVNVTAWLGIGHAGEPLKALSGGTFGALLAAPETDVCSAGLIRRCIGPIGTTICASVFILSGLFFIFMADWKVFFVFTKKKNAEPEKMGENGTKVMAVRNVGDPTQPEAAPEKTEPEPEAKPAAPPEPLTAPAVVQTPAPEKTEPEPKPDLVRSEPQPETEPEAEPEAEPDKPQSVLQENKPAVIPAAAAANPYDPYAQPQKQTVTRSRSTPPPQTTDSGRPYELPPVSLLDRPKETRNEDVNYLDLAKATLQATLDSFEINGTVCNTVVGPRITRFEIDLQPGVRVEKVTQIQNNIAKDMRAESIRILAPVPGSDTVGIELPNKVSNMVFLRELMESDTWRNTKYAIPIILGKDVSGDVKVTDLAKAPHLLIAGSTGSGKSVCMNTLIMSLLYHFSPFDLKLILVDPKYVELEIYRPLPHLITPLVNDPTKVPYALRWGVNEMEHRYQQMARVKAKNLEAFNNRPPDPEPVMDENGDPIPQKLPLLIIIVDELADIMMTEARKDVETSICRIAQKGRAAGIHLVIATQTPRKDIITGTIKANLPTKISFKVSTGMDSRVILDAQGAEKLLGKGDMLFKGPAGETERIQGSMVSDPEIQKVADFVSSQVAQHFDTTVVLEEQDGEEDDGENSFPDFEPEDDGPSDFIKVTVAKYLRPGDDENMRKALEIILRENKASTSYLQRRMGIGYNKAADIIDQLEQRGVVSAPLAGGQKRNILIFDELNRPPENS
ncbi:MAG: DNA translocase FtsK 4TM domain-containing protein [Lentisphaeria bacterium]|nr:DNA translocase FtsK 4TM domain-containing protein [Lentisphaeria bacterium]